jgi:predicted enzyme involved in methoxymalonyl-ACP biosynthesis
MQSYNDLRKNLKKDFSDLKKIKLALLSDNASQFLNIAIKGYGYEQKLNFDIYEAEYNQIDLQIFDQSSELYEFKPEFIFINRSTEKLLKEFYKHSHSIDE